MTLSIRAVLGTVFFACLAARAPAAGNELQPLGDAASDKPLAPWRVVGLPQQDPEKKPFTRFSIETVQGKRALRIDADHSYGNLFHPVPASSTNRTLTWAWRVDKLNPDANLTERRGDDTTIKVCAMFDEPLDVVPFVERQFLRSARGRTDDPVPAATVCYVWDNMLPVGKVLDSPFTRRLRYIILRSGPNGLGQWQTEKRNLDEDFKRTFSDEMPDKVPPLIGIAIGADSDNTRTHTVAHAADVVLAP
ncbi:MAG TPA: DUF3047 domain-containing protein [Ideonella sp.]|nr:DUF3047 domain-containing protein [Ideonella sp.]